MGYARRAAIVAEDLKCSSRTRRRRVGHPLRSWVASLWALGLARAASAGEWGEVIAGGGPYAVVREPAEVEVPTG